MDEFETIARLFRPLADGAPEALNLLDDAAVIPARPGYDLVVTTDTLVEGVHFLPADEPGLVAEKLLGVNLSDLSAKGAEPYGYFLNLAWPPGWDEGRRRDFAEGLSRVQARTGLRLFGGDTVSTPGPLTIGATLLGHVPTGTMVRRSGAGPGDLVLVSGSIGDGWLGLQAALGKLADADPASAAFLRRRYQVPESRLELAATLRRHATAAADVSDGLLADAGHIGAASGVGIEIDLDRVPLSPPARAWVEAQPDRGEALVRLAIGGDDYEIVCTAPSSSAAALRSDAGVTPVTVIGRCIEGQGVRAICLGQTVTIDSLGWRHG